MWGVQILPFKFPDDLLNPALTVQCWSFPLWTTETLFSGLPLFTSEPPQLIRNAAAHMYIPSPDRVTPLLTSG